MNPYVSASRVGLHSFSPPPLIPKRHITNQPRPGPHYTKFLDEKQRHYPAYIEKLLAQGLGNGPSFSAQDVFQHLNEAFKHDVKYAAQSAAENNQTEAASFLHHLHTTLYVLPQFSAHFPGLKLRIDADTGENPPSLVTCMNPRTFDSMQKQFAEGFVDYLNSTRCGDVDKAMHLLVRINSEAIDRLLSGPLSADEKSQLEAMKKKAGDEYACLWHRPEQLDLDETIALMYYTHPFTSGFNIVRGISVLECSGFDLLANMARFFLASLESGFNKLEKFGTVSGPFYKSITLRSDEERQFASTSIWNPNAQAFTDTLDNSLQDFECAAVMAGGRDALIDRIMKEGAPNGIRLVYFENNPISFTRAEKHSYIRDSLKFGYDLELKLEGAIGVDLDAFNALFIEGGQMEAGISNCKPFVVTRKEMIDIGGFQYPRYHMVQLPMRPMP